MGAGAPHERPVADDQRSRTGSAQAINGRDGAGQELREAGLGGATVGGGGHRVGSAGDAVGRDAERLGVAQRLTGVCRRELQELVELAARAGVVQGNLH